MKERPIPFTAESVRAILEGRKTQTRRVIVPQPQAGSTIEGYGTHVVFSDGTKVRCPYGPGKFAEGSRLWVRETWQLCPTCGRRDFRADANQEGTACRSCDEPLGRWKSSRFMRREYSRILLELTAVRVERLQDIDRDDAVREGMPGVGNYGAKDWESSGVARRQWRNEDNQRVTSFGEKAEFADYWDTLNAKRGYGWDANPWVWVLTFRVLEPHAS